VNAVIVTIGEEILIGQIVDTNSAWIANQLNLLGIRVKKIISISDSADEIKSTVYKAINDFDLILITGGLGPTNDDITKQALCELYDTELYTHVETLEHIRKIFAKRNLPLTYLNAKQAEVPSNSEVLFNPNGTAPGMLFNRNGKLLIAMPGVPFEMKAIMEIHVLPRLASQSGGFTIVHKTVHTFGLPESFLAERIAEWENNLPSDIGLAYLPSPLSIRLRLSSSGINRDLIEQKIQNQINGLLKIIPQNIFGYDDDSMVSVVADLFLKTQSKLALAESCTGGTIAHLITQLPGSSNFFIGGIVAYSNSIKTNLLGVDPNSIELFGAVSREVVEQMANGARLKFNADFAIATSGIAGPSGGSPEKPVGTVWIAVSSAQKTVSERFVFGHDRERNILRSSITALNMLRQLIIYGEKNVKNEEFFS
jgi:nicotinamide-nucleotide amidase